MGEPAETVCCPTCRLVQLPADRCASCGRGPPVSVEAAPDLFLAQPAATHFPGRQRLLDGPWSPLLLLALLPGGIAVPLGVTCLVAWVASRIVDDTGAILWIVSTGIFTLVWLALVILIGLYRPRRRAGRARPFDAIEPEVRLDNPETHWHRGTAKRLRDSVTCFLSHETCLVARLSLVPPSGHASFLWRRRGARFVLHQQDGERIVVTGELLLDGPASPPKLTSRGTLSLFGELVTGQLSREAMHFTRAVLAETCLREGTSVEIAGAVTREIVPELAEGYRDGGESLVLRGRPGQPIIVRWT